MNLLLVLTDQDTRKFFLVDYGAWITAFLLSTLCLYNLSSLSLLLIDVVLDLTLAHVGENQLQAFYVDPVGVCNALFNYFPLRILPRVSWSLGIYWKWLLCGAALGSGCDRFYQSTLAGLILLTIDHLSLFSQ